MRFSGAFSGVKDDGYSVRVNRDKRKEKKRIVDSKNMILFNQLEWQSYFLRIGESGQTNYSDFTRNLNCE
jgi:hypothetical protein